MNINQSTYRLGFLREAIEDSFSLLVSYESISRLLDTTSYSNIDDSQLLLTIGYAGVGYVFSKKFLKSIQFRFMSFGVKRLKEFQKNFHKAEKIIINDKDGLDYLLDRTTKSELLEWGGTHNSHITDSTMYVDHILDYEEVKKKKLVYLRMPTSLIFNSKLSDEYSGTHHFHPSIFTKYLGGMNFYVSYLDKFNQKNDSINFLTFNMPYGPEILAFNHVNIFIPKSKEDKTILVKANKQIIMDYLKS